MTTVRAKKKPIHGQWRGASNTVTTDERFIKGDVSIMAKKSQILTKLVPTENGKPHFTDKAEARLFLKENGSKYLYLKETKKVGYDLIYQGHKWIMDSKSTNGIGTLVDELTDAQRFEADALKEEADALMESLTDDSSEKEKREAKKKLGFAEAYEKAVNKYSNADGTESLLRKARSYVQRTYDHFDHNPMILNTPTGVITLEDSVVHPNDPSYMCMKSTAVGIRRNPEKMKTWENHLNLITCNDSELKHYLQLHAGKCVLGIAYGGIDLAFGQGGNGKGVYYNTLVKVLGDYGAIADSNQLIMCKQQKDFMRTSLLGVRLVVFPEVAEKQTLDDGELKIVASTDPIRAAHKGEDSFYFQPTHTAVWYVNHLPNTSAKDNGTWDRLIVVPFNARIRNTNIQVINYDEYLFRECGPEILAWMVDGAKMFLENGQKLTQPKAVIEATKDYRYSCDSLARYLAECTTPALGATVGAGDLYNSYRHFCDLEELQAVPSTSFPKAMETAGFKKETDKHTNKRYYIGLRILPVFKS